MDFLLPIGLVYSFGLWTTAEGWGGPYGSGFDMNDFYNKDVLFVAGGLGLVPLRSLITPVAAESKRFGRITLISGCRNPSEELYRDLLNAFPVARQKPPRRAPTARLK